MDTLGKGRQARPLKKRATLRKRARQGVMEIVSPLIAQMETLREENAHKEAAISSLQRRLAEMEARLQVQENIYHIPQSLSELRPRELPPPGMTAMQSIMGQLDVEETTEELLAQLKVLG